ncbi:hypothetical protein DV737_g4089, partial [Chaetothyriales sp. CBS 132003]
MASSTLHRLLLVRGLFKGSNNTCISFADATAAQPLTGTLYFHQLMWYISAACAVFACIVGLGLAAAHIFCYREPHAQRQLIRILWTPPVFGVFSFLAVYSYHISGYMVPIAELYEIFALVSVYLLFLWHLSHATNLDGQIRAIISINPNYGFPMFRRTYLLVMQAVPVRIITTVAAWILTAATCTNSAANKHSHTIINIINSVSVTFALLSLLRFLLMFKHQLQQQDPKIVLRMIAFKIVIALQFIQQIVLSILSSTNVLKPTRTQSYDDLHLGLSSFLTSMEVALISILLLIAFWPTEFRSRRYLAVTTQLAEQAPHGMRLRDASHAPLNRHYDSNGHMADINGNALAPRKYSFVKAIADSVGMLDILRALGNSMALLRQD